MTPHGAEAYPGIRHAALPGWPLFFLVLEPGQSFVAAGGEEAYAYETRSGARAEAILLRPGDRATVVAWDGPAFLATWRIERATGAEGANGSA
jgi:hypothetical protein